ncbi:MAG: aminotransferase class V-fold PLP-dependent enzyme [Candidatus Bathyarchaeota archaeon]|nr:aminotransferase class V-fold PLP-dependent enzyme [Candidatus Bathyarchaeota archaeon]MDH5787276.1 aminotransferase class V-fold PLP-dependent enzyme [Candidatus Bathyarchaeota archaeon]
MKREAKDGLCEETLDPEDWGKMRALGHRMLDDMLTYLQNIRSEPSGAPTQKAIEEICVPLTQEGEGEEKVYQVFKQSILPYTLPITRPRFWGVVGGTGSPYGMLTEMLRTGMNGAQETFFAEAYVHKQVINWIKEMLGFPKEAGGVLVSGGSEANFTGLAVARNAKADVDMKAKGVQGLTRRMALYCSDETHHCLERSVEILGLGNEALRWIPTDDNCRIRLEALKKAIEDDRKRNNHPFCVIGCAGTVNSGAFDDLNALADLAKKENMWFHVDGAFGAWVKISKTHRHLADGMERADSLAVDLHKWMYMPYSIGCTLVKDRLAHYSTFVYGHEAKYLKSSLDKLEDQTTDPHNLALPLSRNFTSLKAYMLLRAYGKNKYSNLIQQNIDQINYLTELIRKEPEMEITAPVVSNVVCFRYKPKGLTEPELEKLNEKICSELNQRSFWMISDTTIKGKYMLRACCVNHRSKKQDFDFLVNIVKKAGEKYSLR